jgi:hypothetical protein
LSLARSIARPIARPVARPITGESSGGGATSPSAEAQQFFDRLFTLPSDERQTLYANLIDAIVDAGVFPKLDGLYIFAAEDEGTALTNLIQESYRAMRQDLAGTTTWTLDSGYSGGGNNAQISSRLIPSTAVGANCTQNSASIGCWIGETGTTAGQVINDGANDGSSLKSVIYHAFTDGRTYGRVNSASSISANTVSVTGTHHMNRSGASAVQLYQNGLQIASGTTSATALPSGPIVASCNKLTRAFWVGGSLNSTEVGALHTALAAYFTGMGATP